MYHNSVYKYLGVCFQEELCLYLSVYAIYMSVYLCVCVCECLLGTLDVMPVYLRMGKMAPVNQLSF